MMRIGLCLGSGNRNGNVNEWMMLVFVNHDGLDQELWP